MSLGSKLKIENKGFVLTSVFYAIVGALFIVLLPMANYPPHIGIIGIFSLATAYATLRKRDWAIWFVIVVFFVATTFSAYMLNYYLQKDLITGLGILAYLALTWIATIYIAAKRSNLKS